MTEKLLLTEALDERDFMRKKIESAIGELKVITVKRQMDPRTSFGTSKEEFEEAAKSKYQSICDMIARYERLNVAITLSNANTKITVSGKEMTVAEAIARRKMLESHDDLKTALLNNIKRQYTTAINQNQAMMNEATQARDSYINSFLSTSEKKLTDEMLESINKVTEPIKPEVVDPVSIKEQIDKLEAEIEEFKTQINTAIKVSNANTTVEF